MKWLLVFAGIAANASASVLIKLAMQPPRQPPSLADPQAMLRNGPLWLGLLLYGLTFVLYAAALMRLPLNIVHPLLTAGAIASVALASSLLLREPFYWTTGVGIALIIAGVILISARAG